MSRSGATEGAWPAQRLQIALADVIRWHACATRQKKSKTKVSFETLGLVQVYALIFFDVLCMHCFLVTDDVLKPRNLTPEIIHLCNQSNHIR
jgi:hypothetical protein